MASWSSGYVIGNWIRVSRFESWKIRKSFFFLILFLKSSKNYNGINSIPKNIKGRKKAKKKLLQRSNLSNTYLNTYVLTYFLLAMHYMTKNQTSRFMLVIFLEDSYYQSLIQRPGDSREHCLVGIHYCGLDWMRKLGMKHKTESNVCDHSKYDSYLGKMCKK